LKVGGGGVIMSLRHVLRERARRGGQPRDR
jgi:hypothetical protein